MSPSIVQKLCRSVTNVTHAMARNPETTLVCVSLVFQLLMTRLSVTWSSTNHSNTDTPTAVPPGIFPPDSPVSEFPDGNLQAAQDRFRESDTDVSVVMYYAHWDGSSLLLAEHFDDMAREMFGVTFVAVNCWYPYGTCRHQIRAPYYPVIIAHHGQQEGLQYKGIMTSPEISRFLHKVAAPFLYVSSKKMLDRLQALEDTLVIAHFNFTKYQESEAPGFESFHRAALLSLEKDPIQHVQFGIITNPALAKIVNLDKPKTIVLLRTLKEPLFYPAKRKFKAKPIMNWVFENREQLSQWIVPVGVKSLIMSKQLVSKPVLILFTKHLHSDTFLNDVHLLRIAAMDYYNCNRSSLIRHRINQIEQYRQQIADNLATTHSECCQTLALTTKLPHIPSPPTGRQNVCEVCEQFTQSTMSDPFNIWSISSQNCRSSSMLNTLLHNFVTSPDSCSYVDNYYSPFSHFELCCQSRALCSGQNGLCNNKGLLYQKHLITTNVLDSSQYTDCNMCSSKHRKLCSDQSFYNFHRSYQNCTQEESFTGLGCRTNKSVNFFAMRLDQYEDFAERIGLQSSMLDMKEGMSALAIIDIKNEVQHVLPLSNGLTTAAIQDMLVNFTSANLSRHLRTTQVSSSTSMQGGNKLKPATGLTVTEVVSDTFEAVVLNNKMNVLLFYYAPWCGYCSQLHHVYQLLARFLQDTPNLTIARINGDLNDLPWEFTAPNYPTLLLFPARRKDNSIRYPQNWPYNLPNMLRFVLENTQ